MPSVANQHRESESADARSPGKGYSSLPAIEDGGGHAGRRAEGSDIELSAVEKVVDCSIVDEDAILDDLKVLFRCTSFDAYASLVPFVIYGIFNFCASFCYRSIKPCQRIASKYCLLSPLGR